MLRNIPNSNRLHWNPVTVRRQQSALVPILHRDFKGKRIAIYNPDVREQNPMSAVLFKNSTG